MRWLIAVVIGASAAALQYGWRGPRHLLAYPLPAVFRAIALALLAGLLLDAPAAPAPAARPWVALDASLSMAAAADTAAWRAALDSARSGGGDSLFLFGDSLRPAPTAPRPDDRHSDVEPVVERAAATGRPVIVVTDGALSQPGLLRQLPPGSRVIVVPRPPARDVAAAELDVPRALVSGDTVQLRLTLAAGSGGSAAGTAGFFLDDRRLAVQPFDALAPYVRRDLTIRVPVAGVQGPAVVRAVVTAPGDAEPRNDTVAVGVDVSGQPGAVFVSTSPDYDARYALAILRGATALPTRAYYYLSPGNWREDGSYARVSEAEVRAVFRDAPVAVLHGDTAVFGPPRKATRAPLALIVPSTGDGSEWYAAEAPVSPLSDALSGIAWDSLPPLLVGPGPEPLGTWHGLEARRGREPVARTIVAGDDAPRRVVIVAASDLWRWEFRGGQSAEAFTALWGGIFDYLASERADRRAALPDARLVRAGDPVFWRRGVAADSEATVRLARRGAPGIDTLRLRFAVGSGVARSAPLRAGIYDVSVQGGAAVLAVNAPAELVPRAPNVAPGVVPGTPVGGSAPPARDAAWPYVLLLVALCAEWVSRRRAGFR